MTKHTPQAKRLIEFIKFTGMSHTEFSRQCEFKSHRTVQATYTEGKTPSHKTLKKIVYRFPQLNYDWVLMGIGDMVNVAYENNTSPNDELKSKKSGFSQIQKKLSSHDINLNELSLDVEKMLKITETNMLVYTQSMAILNNKIEGMSNTITTVVNKLLDDSRVRNDRYNSWIKTEREYIDKLDLDRRSHRLKDMKEANANFNKLSNKVRDHVEETRELQKKLIEEKLKKGVELLTKEMHKNAVAQTDFAIKALLDKFSLKKIIPGLGSPNKVSNPKHQK